MSYFDKWKVYVDPTMAAGAKNRKALKEFATLKWNNVAYYCDEKGNSVTVAQMAQPDYVPWIIIQATKEVPNVNQSVFHMNAKYSFLYNPDNGKILFKRLGYYNDKTFHKIKPGRKVYQKVISKIEEAEIQVYPRKIRGRKGTSSLSAGFFYAPYVPVMTTPKTLTKKKNKK